MVICLTFSLFFLFQTNEVNQGDALEHNFSAIYGALTLPINHIFSVQKFPVVRQCHILYLRNLHFFGKCSFIPYNKFLQ